MIEKMLTRCVMMATSVSGLVVDKAGKATVGGSDAIHNKNQGDTESSESPVGM